MNIIKIRHLLVAYLLIVFGYCIFKLLTSQFRVDLDFDFDPEPYSPSDISYLRQQVKGSLDFLPEFRNQVRCDILFDPTHQNYSTAVTSGDSWKFTLDDFEFLKFFESSPDFCLSLKRFFPFFKKPLTLEESEFPLAYGMLVYKDMKQLLYILSSFYQPQNSFCIAVDENSSYSFKKKLRELSTCFPNIFIHEARKVDYCGFGVTNAVMSCLKLLSKQKNPWRYYQYLSGVDLPLKTNLEMVRIFKALNGTYNAEVTKVNPERIERSFGDPPLRLWKSSLSATFSRESADIIATSSKVNDLLQYLRKTKCSDESIWATIGGQPEHIPVPGGFSAPAFYSKIMEELYGNPKKLHFPNFEDSRSEFKLKSYYISRYQVWDTKDELGTGLVCKGNFTNYSCVYGIKDLPNLVSRPELVGHKFYLDLHPAAFFCLYEKIRLRSLDFEHQSNFNADNYRNLPQVQLSQGKKLDEVNFFF